MIISTDFINHVTLKFRPPPRSAPPIDERVRRGVAAGGTNPDDADLHAYYTFQVVRSHQVNPLLTAGAGCSRRSTAGSLKARHTGGDSTLQHQITRDYLACTCATIQGQCFGLLSKLHSRIRYTRTCCVHSWPRSPTMGHNPVTRA